jgi:2'-5' RNA ligase
MDEASNGQPVVRCCRGLFALVDYLPHPLGAYLDELRAELVPGCRLQSHVTVLPPRALSAPDEVLVEALDERLSREFTFEISIGDVEVFETTNVIYLDLRHGRDEIERLHRTLSAGAFAYDEPFLFHPHITLAQQISTADLPGKLALARERWAQYPHSRQFTLDHLTFVQNVDPHYWRTLSEHPLQEATLLKTV